MTTDTVTIEKLYQDWVWVIQGYSIKPASVDAWEAAVRAYIQHVNHAPERYLVYDLLPVENLGFTSYMRQRTTTLAQDNRDAMGRVAVVMNINPMLRYVFEPFFRLTGSRLQPHLDVRLFGNRDEAVNWVASSLPEAIKNGGQ
ncbi:MAG: hypothetical protein H7X77_01340 [Anaerolineae bacterium]|nr:hypothetical protein [Anaerolineae bacterium]